MNLEFKSMCRRKKHPLFTEIYWWCSVYSYWSGRHARNTNKRFLECRSEQTYCQILGDDSQILLYWKRNLQKDKCGSGETDKVSIDCQTRSCMDSSFGRKLWTLLRIERNRNAKEKPKLDTARRLAGIYFIDPNDKEHEDTLKKSEEKIGKTCGTSHAVQGKLF